MLHKSQPLELKPALLLADCMLEGNQPAKAVELLAPLGEEYPDDHAVIYELGMALLNSRYTIDFGATMAVASISLIPVLVVFFTAQRYFIQGLVVSGVKG